MTCDELTCIFHIQQYDDVSSLHTPTKLPSCTADSTSPHLYILHSTK